MLYTTQGLMTAGDMADYREQTDTGVTTVFADDLPEWLDGATPCPLDGVRVDDHDSLTVTDAGGTIVACTHHA